MSAREPRASDEPIRRPSRMGLRRALSIAVVVLLAAEVALLAPHLMDAGRALVHLHWGWLSIAAVAELASMVYFARLQQRMLRAGGVRVPLPRAIATALAANAMSVTLPAGPVLSTGYTFRRMRRWGASGPLATWGMVASGALSTVALAVIGIFGTGLANGERPDPFLVGAEVVVAATIIFGLRLLSQRPQRLLRVGEYTLMKFNEMLHQPPTRGRDRFRAVIAETVLIQPRTRDWALGLTFAMLNWVADLLCLIAACRSVGADGPTIAVAFVAYAAGMAASSIPLLPGGLGLVDGTLVLALTRGGLPASLATAGVLVYRLLSFVLIAAIGWVAWLLIRRSDRLRPPPALAQSNETA